MSLFARWVQLWDRRETAEALALVRIAVPLVMLWDLVSVVRYGLVETLWAPLEEGGMGPATYAEPITLFYRFAGASSQSAWILLGVAIAAALTLSVGLFSRTSALVLLLAYAQLGQLSPDADRGIDTLLRNMLIVLAFSGAGATLSLDARLWHGRFVRDVQVTAWPRYLIVVQLVLLYFCAGMLKQSANWSFQSGYSALFLVMQKPHLTSVELPHALLVTLYPLTQLGTVTTVLWERAALLLPLLLWLRASRARGGTLRHWVNRLRLLEVWVATGVFFHLALAALLALGMFPWGCLALYPALAAPATLRRWARALRAPRAQVHATGSVTEPAR